MASLTMFRLFTNQKAALGTLLLSLEVQIVILTYCYFTVSMHY